jgi:PAS domain S-box-containing protein
MSNVRAVLLMTGGALYAVLVFILDVVTPAGIEVWVLNVAVILLPVLYRSTRMVVFLSLACSAMVIIGHFDSPPGGKNPASWDILNRGMGLVTMWLVALMAVNTIKRSNQLDYALGRLRREIAEHSETARALEQNEERLRLAADGAGMGTFDANFQTGKVIWSASQLRMLGYEAMPCGEFTIDMWRSRVHPEDLARVLDAREQALRSRSVYSIEYRINRADNGETAWLAVSARFHYNESGEAVRFLGVSFDITRRKELERELFAREVLKIAEHEQRQIGQDLHDGVGQELTGLGLIAESLAHHLPETSAEKRIAHRLIRGLDGVHQQVRELARGLILVHVGSRGLAAALDDLAARTAEASGISVIAECSEEAQLPDQATATQLFRIAQEAVGNAVRHGKPRRIQLRLLSETDGLRLRITDDGIGMQDGPDHGHGLGLRIMHYRAGQIGGVLHVGPTDGGGTVVSCTLPRSDTNGEKKS